MYEFWVMKVMLCAATQNEIASTTDFINKNNLDVEVVITGVGMLATTYAITKAIAIHKPQFIVQAGVAGSINKNLPIASVVLVQHESAGDLGVMENGRFHSVFEMGLAHANEWPWENGRLKNNNDYLTKSNLAIVDAVTVNEVTTDESRIHYYEQNLKASIESMEGAALHYVCLKETIPFIQLRSISNYIGERDKSKWMLTEAISKLNDELQLLLGKILKS